jgi:hypothetical protein
MDSDIIEIVACHQPNFLPWLGYFAKIHHSDLFFLLDDVQFTQGQSKHNWTTRVRILTLSGPLWLSVPVLRKGKGKQLIRDIEIIKERHRWLRKTFQTLKQSYGKTKHFEEYFSDLERILTRKHDFLADLNVELIKWLVKILGINTKIQRSSDFAVASTSNQRLIDLTKAAGGSVYLSGDGAEAYQLEGEFQKNGITLEKIGFKHPIYKQTQGTEFVPGLSIIDALFNIGAESVHTLLAKSR